MGYLGQVSPARSALIAFCLTCDTKATPAPSKGHDTSLATSAIPNTFPYLDQADPRGQTSPQSTAAFDQSHTSATKPSTSLDGMSGSAHWDSHTTTLEPTNPQPPTSSQSVTASMGFNGCLDDMLYSLNSTNPQPPTSSQSVTAPMEYDGSLDEMLHNLYSTDQNLYTTTLELTNAQAPTSSQSVTPSAGHNGSLDDMLYGLYPNFHTECPEVY